jgi:hypothetical protein
MRFGRQANADHNIVMRSDVAATFAALSVIDWALSESDGRISPRPASAEPRKKPAGLCAAGFFIAENPECNGIRVSFCG